MIKRVLLGLIIILFACDIYSQNIKGAVIGGLNISQVDGDFEPGAGYHKFGFNVGAAAIVPFGKKWSASIETIFNQKGSYIKSWKSEPDDGSYYLVLDYLEVPVLVHFSDKGGITAGAGFSWGRIVNFIEKEHGENVNWTKSTIPYKSDDINVIVDLRFKLVKRLKFNFRYAYSVRKIRTRINSNGLKRDQYNNLITFRLIYVFNETLSPAELSKKKVN